MDSQGGSHGFGWEIGAEFGDSDSLVSVGLADSSPDSSELASVDFGWSFINIHDSLSEVVRQVLACANVFDFEEGLFGALVLSVSSESEELGFDPESDGGLLVAALSLMFCDFDHWFIN